jgi:hypothetical protein
METLTRSALCLVFHCDEAHRPERLDAGPYHFKPLLASFVGFAPLADALSVAAACEGRFKRKRTCPAKYLS